MEAVGLGLEITELRLGLPGGGGLISASKNNEKKRVFSEVEVEDKSHGDSEDEGRRKQVVGWPPVCSYRQRNSFKGKGECDKSEGIIMGMKKQMYVKVSFEGTPFLRKVDLGMVKGYGDLVRAMEKLFGSSIGGSEYTVTYEDRDGDWMLVGDVPWKMFIESCKRLRIMKKTEVKRSEMNSLSQ
ncbi:auxin-induced protein AUX22-like [Benincasa hispida]|uniref:auxin-induced protein AUX22-like n=1 Tax=Benincasa hispida TaxID=102211 RepID=UPI0018FFF137|nr:auxin-induced protein AUX22-like [Benincasa hispida]